MRDSERVLCPCGSGMEYEELYDARGIYCGRYCPKCEGAVRARYRADIFTDSNYWHDEPIEED